MRTSTTSKQFYTTVMGMKVFSKYDVAPQTVIDRFLNKTIKIVGSLILAIFGA